MAIRMGTNGAQAKFLNAPAGRDRKVSKVLGRLTIHKYGKIWHNF